MGTASIGGWFAGLGQVGEQVIQCVQCTMGILYMDRYIGLSNSQLSLIQKKLSSDLFFTAQMLYKFELVFDPT